MNKVYVKTYGCQMNERDSEQVLQMFQKRGYGSTKDESEADVILINTCSVREQAEQKALGKMGHMKKHKTRKPHVVYGFLGCMAQSKGPELLDAVPHTDLVVGTQKYHKVVEHVDHILTKRLQARMDDPLYTHTPERLVDIDEEKDSQNTIRNHQLEERQATAFVSIMQGCNMKCSFCIVPYTRGGERGRPIADIVTEVRDLVERGIKEVTLLGQIVNLYGRHEFPIQNGQSPFVQLLRALHAIDGLERIRFTSPHPVGYKEDLIQAFAELPKLASHIHLPLQSGSDRILKLMKRPYKAERFKKICHDMRAARPDLAITTDIIVAFPGETEEEYQMTRELCQEVQFDNAFIFRYSKRRGTPAADIDDTLQLPEEIKEARNQDLLALVNDLAKPRYQKLVGQEVEILCEGPSKNNKERLMGRTSTNKIVVFEGKAERHQGQIMPVHIEDHYGFTLYGRADVKDV